ISHLPSHISHLRSRRLLSSPRVVATVHRLEDLRSLATHPPDADVCDLLEFRIDNLRDHLDTVERAMAASALPCLVTARHPEEGGAGALDHAERETLLRRFLPVTALVDVEIRSLPAMTDLVEKAHGSRVVVVASCHDFEKPIPVPDLETAMTDAQTASADVLKIAMTLSSLADLCPLALFTEAAVTNGNLVATMGMGPLGKVSRLVLAAAGSCLNYGYLHEPNAPGQWPAAELKRLITEIAPDS
ncbi:MAG: type I 3-dehydroquinate dehydratase, partial [Verrucomicrobiales bacterium]